MDKIEFNNILEKISKLETFLESYPNKKEEFKKYVEQEKEKLTKSKKAFKQYIEKEFDNIDKKRWEVRRQHAENLSNVNKEIEKNKKIYEEKISNINKQRRKNEKILDDIETLYKQYSDGFPLLAKAYKEYFEIIDAQTIKSLETKPHPAFKASEIVKTANAIKRVAVEEAKKYEYLIEYYETLFPFLLEVKGELLDEIASKEILKDYTEEERYDRVTWYVTKEEYRKLSVIEKNQLALDRYWQRRKTKRGIGNLYERYIGYLYEIKGYDVEYTGILGAFEDLGRDLIAKKKNEVIIVQCKYWSKFKKIYENHIFQFFGTYYRYKFDYKYGEQSPLFPLPEKNVKAVFYTKTVLSKLAKEFANDFGIELIENFELLRYPCIKCNVARESNEKIYHLPFDQQYDTTKVEPSRDEFFAMTVEEAERKGFRRAWRWRGKKE